MQTITESSCVYDIASSNSGHFFASESTIRAIADAMGASVHIGSGTGNIVGQNNYSAPIEGTPFVEIGDFYFTIMYRTGNHYKYMCLYKKDYSTITYIMFYSGSANYVLGHSDKYNIKYIACSTAAFIFCEYENVDGVVKHCVFRKDNGASISIYHSDSSSSTAINIPTSTTTDTVDYLCIQELAFHLKLAVFRGLYSGLVHYSTGFRTIQLNGETYEALVGAPVFCIKMS